MPDILNMIFCSILKNRESASPEIKRTEIDYLIDHDIQHRIIQNARKSLLGDKIILKDAVSQDYLLLKNIPTFSHLSVIVMKKQNQREALSSAFLFFKMFLVNVFDCLVWINHNIKAFCFSLIFVD